MPSFLPKPASPVLRRSDPLARGLVGAWPFYEGAGTTINDISGKSFKATIQVAPVWGGGGFGNSLAFNGSTQYAIISPLLSGQITTQITMSALIQASGTSFSQVDEAVFTENFNIGNVTFAMAGNHDAGGGNQSFSTGFYNGSWHLATADFTSLFGKWTMVTGTYDGTSVRLYFNGALATAPVSVGASLPSSVLTSNWYIGRRWDSGNFFGGNIADVRIYNRALSTNEVAQLYQDPFSIYRPRSEWWRTVVASTVHRRTLGQRTGSRAA